jgi:uncharacterized protein with GYD domain
MPKFLIKASYTTEGTRGLLKEGGSGRRAAIQKLMESVGGQLDALYFAWGEHDVYVIVDMPDAASAMAASLSVNSSGGATVTTVPLITPEEMDAATKKTAAYRSPGT